MDRKELLGAMIDAIINNDAEAAQAAFAPYVQDKSREIITPPTEPEVDASAITESVLLKEFSDVLHDSPIKLSGDNVLVNGKAVGVLQNDPTDFDSGINFIENGGKFSKEFTTVEELFNFLIDKYSKGGKQ